MDTLELIVEPGAPRRRPPSRKPVRRKVKRRVTVPEPAPLALQIVALVLLVVLLAGTVVFAIEVDDVAVRMAAGAVFLIAAVLLVSWIALVLSTGVGPRQILDVLKQFFGVVRDAEKPGEEDDGEGGRERRAAGAEHQADVREAAPGPGGTRR